MGMFDKQAAAKIAPAKPAKGNAKATVAIKGLQDYAFLTAIEKAIAGVKTSFRATVIDQAADTFYSTICSTKAKPASYRGEEGIATASIECRKRGANSPLSENEVSLLRDHGLEPHKEVSVPELFGINPAYAANKDLMDRVEAALKTVKDLPADFIVVQDEKYKYSVTDEMLNTACATALPKEVVSVLTTLAVKPKLSETNMDELLKFLGNLMQDAPANVDTDTKVA